MGYLGNEPTTGHFPVQTNLVGPGPTYTLDRAPASAGAIEVSVAGVLQPTTSYSVSGTTLTMAGVTSSIPIFIRYLGETLILPTIADGVVVEAKIGASAVTTSKIANTAVTLAKMAANSIDSDQYVDGSVDDAHLATGISASKLTGALPAISGANLTNITAGKHTIWIPAVAMVSPTTNGAEANAVETTATKPEMKVLDFHQSTVEYAQFSIAMPKSWNEGTVTAKFYWTHATAVATNVVWGIQGVCVSDNDTIDATFGTGVTVTDTFHNAAEDLAISPETAAITLGGSPAEDDLAYFQVYRNSSHGDDTTNSTDARLIGVKIFFTTNAENDA